MESSSSSVSGANGPRVPGRSSPQRTKAGPRSRHPVRRKSRTRTTTRTAGKQGSYIQEEQARHCRTCACKPARSARRLRRGDEFSLESLAAGRSPARRPASGARANQTIVCGAQPAPGMPRRSPAKAKGRGLPIPHQPLFEGACASAWLSACTWMDRVIYRCRRTASRPSIFGRQEPVCSVVPRQPGFRPRS